MKKEYCKYCGTLMIEKEPMTANNFTYFGISTSNDKYDHKTGKIKMYRWIACPRFKNGFFSIFTDSYKHSNHVIGEEYLV